MKISDKSVFFLFTKAGSTQNKLDTEMSWSL